MHLIRRQNVRRLATSGPVRDADFGNRIFVLLQVAPVQVCRGAFAGFGKSGRADANNVNVGTATVAMVSVIAVLMAASVIISHLQKRGIGTTSCRRVVVIERYFAFRLSYFAQLLFGLMLQVLSASTLPAALYPGESGSQNSGRSGGVFVGGGVHGVVMLVITTTATMILHPRHSYLVVVIMMIFVIVVVVAGRGNVFGK
mmetsp:Transcript_74803/g.112758  ORF Transcript_74803/g.112758 Transcript_74803/m.112758 type:complete len:200 (-) Transcript_74803:407-1006(-)